MYSIQLYILLVYFKIPLIIESHFLNDIILQELTSFRREIGSSNIMRSVASVEKRDNYLTSVMK